MADFQKFTYFYNYDRIILIVNLYIMLRFHSATHIPDSGAESESGMLIQTYDEDR